jgi:hypothetical protein
MTLPKKVGALAALIAGAAAGALWWYWQSIPDLPSGAGAAALRPPPAVITTVTGNPIRSPAEVEAATPQEILHYADALNSSAQSPRADALLLVSLIELYRSVLHTAGPVGDNEEITALLTGNNHLGYAFIPPGSKAINAQGQLCDRWGTPYFFHQISGTQMQVRSGGPDGKLWTSDDIIAGP